MHYKNFDGWNTKKKQLEIQVQNNILFHEREIWWCTLGVNIGDEEDGKNELFERPVLILKKFNRNIALTIPLTTKIKNNQYYFSFTYNNTQFAVILSQLRLLSSKRFTRKIRRVSHQLFETIKQKIIEVSI